MIYGAVESRPAKALDIIESTTDDDLVKLVYETDESALIALYRRYGTLVYSIALRTLGNAQDAEEVTQDVFLRIWKRSHQFDPARGSFAAWLTTSTRNAAVDRYRKRQRREPEHATFSLDEAPQLWEVLQVEEADDDLRRTLAAAVRRLSPPQQEAILLAYFYGMSQPEIAQKLQRPLGTVKSHIRQGMERLRQIWMAQET